MFFLLYFTEFFLSLFCVPIEELGHTRNVMRFSINLKPRLTMVHALYFLSFYEFWTLNNAVTFNIEFLLLSVALGIELLVGAYTGGR